MKYIILGDPFTTGHHDIFLGLYIKLFVELGYNVSFFSPNETEIWMNLPAACKQRVIPYHISDYVSVTAFKTYGVNHFVSTALTWLKSIILVWRMVIKNKQVPVLVFFLWLDHYLDPNISETVIDILFPFHWSGLYFHPRHIREHMINHKSPFYNPDRVLRSRNCRCVAILDETIRSELEKRLRVKKVIVIPDIVDTARTDKKFPLYKAIQKKAGKRKIIACLGSLEKRKSVLFLSKVAEHMKNESFLFIFVGRTYEETFSQEDLSAFNKFKNDPPANCVIYPKAVTDMQLNALVRLSNVIFLGYKDFYHSSNILTKAGAFKRPVIVYNSNYCTAARTKKYHLGTTIKEDSVPQCVQTIKEFSRVSYDAYPDNEAHRRFRSVYSHKNYRKVMRSLLEDYV